MLRRSPPYHPSSHRTARPLLAPTDRRLLGAAHRMRRHRTSTWTGGLDSPRRHLAVGLAPQAGTVTRSTGAPHRAGLRFSCRCSRWDRARSRMWSRRLGARGEAGDHGSRQRETRQRRRRPRQLTAVHGPARLESAGGRASMIGGVSPSRRASRPRRGRPRFLQRHPPHRTRHRPKGRTGLAHRCRARCRRAL